MCSRRGKPKRAGCGDGKRRVGDMECEVDNACILRRRTADGRREVILEEGECGVYFSGVI